MKRAMVWRFSATNTHPRAIEMPKHAIV